MRREYKIKPKRTKYGDVLYNSKTEAQWAVFFDCLGIEYIYEPRCAEVETGCRVVRHKPDFLLPELSKYVEIKPTEPLGIENTKAAAWSKDIGDCIVLFNLNPPSEKLENGWLFSWDGYSNLPDTYYIYWCECPKCGHIDLAEYHEFTSCGCFTSDELNKMCREENDKGIEISPNFERSKRLLDAYKIANNYKFVKSNRAPKLPVQCGLFG